MVEPTPSAPPTAPQFDWQRSDLRTFEIGDVMGRAFSAVRAEFRPLAGIALLFIFVPQFLFGLLQYFALAQATEGGAASAFLGIGATAIIAGALGLVFTALLAPAAMTYLLLKSFNAEHVSAVESLRLGLSRFWVLLGAGILAGLGMIAGTLALIVPGIILYCGWYVIMPVVVMERRGVTDTLGRSWELTKGHKWMVLVVLIITIVISTILTTIATVPFGQAFVIDPLTSEITTPGLMRSVGAAFAAALAATITAMISAAFVASTYRELRVVKEGVDSAQIADIFS